MNLRLTDATIDDRSPVLYLTDQLFGKLVGDKGYLLKKLKDNFLKKGIEFITKIRKNMKKVMLADIDKLLLRKRAIVESVIDQHKNIRLIEHRRHRSQDNFLVNLIARLTAYSLQPTKPLIEIDSFGVFFV